MCVAKYSVISALHDCICLFESLHWNCSECLDVAILSLYSQHDAHVHVLPYFHAQPETLIRPSSPWIPWLQIEQEDWARNAHLWRWLRINVGPLLGGYWSLLPGSLARLVCGKFPIQRCLYSPFLVTFLRDYRTQRITQTTTLCWVLVGPYPHWYSFEQHSSDFLWFMVRWQARNPQIWLARSQW